MKPGTFGMAAPRVLIVEDDADGREPLTEVLRLQGYDATSAADGAGAIGRIGNEAFDVVVLDLGLPDVAGVDVLRAARARADGPAVIVFTGFHGLKGDAEAAGCDAFVLKPELDELLAGLATLIASRVARTVAARKEHG